MALSVLCVIVTIAPLATYKLKVVDKTHYRAKEQIGSHSTAET